MKYRTWLLLLLVIFWPWHAVRAGDIRRPVAGVSGAELASFLARRPLVLDVRVAGEERGADEKPWGLRCRTCRTERAPYDLEMGFFEDGHASVLRRLRPGQQVLVVCLLGVRARKAAEELHAAGISVVLLEGGLMSIDRALVYGKPPVARVGPD